MAFCTFLTISQIQTGSIVKKSGSSVVVNDNASDAVLVGVVTSSYQDEDENWYAQVNISGVCQVLLKSDWNGEFSAVTVSSDGISAATNDDIKHGYFIPQLPQTTKESGELVTIYWRGIIS